MTRVSNKDAKKGLATRLRQRADELDAAECRERMQAAALERVMSLAYGAFLAGRHRAGCEKDCRAAVHHHKDELGFTGRFDKGSEEWHAMLAATDPVYRRLEVARHMEKHAKSLMTKAWCDADLKINESDFWAVSERMPFNASSFLRGYCEENRLVAAGIREAGLDDEETVSLRRAEANAQVAADLMAEVGITA